MKWLCIHIGSDSVHYYAHLNRMSEIVYTVVNIPVQNRHTHTHKKDSTLCWASVKMTGGHSAGSAHSLWGCRKVHALPITSLHNHKYAGASPWAFGTPRLSFTRCVRVKAKSGQKTTAAIRSLNHSGESIPIEYDDREHIRTAYLKLCLQIISNAESVHFAVCSRSCGCLLFFFLLGRCSRMHLITGRARVSPRSTHTHR